MTLTDERRVTFEGGDVTTPQVRAVARRLRFWIVLASAVIVFVVASIALAGTSASQNRLSATNAQPNGSEAVVRVLRTDHVSVSSDDSLASAITDIDRDPAETTVLVYDPHNYLSRTELGKLSADVATIVLIEPSTTALDALAPSVAQAGYVPSAAKADCTLGPAVKAGTVNGLGRGYRIIASTPPTVGCFGTGGVHSLVRSRQDTQTVWVLGSSTVLTNGNILRGGDAALDLGILGAHSHVVWYLPSLADVEAAGPDGVLPTPPWEQYVIWLFGIVAIAAIVWRGRRFGPLVVERMPVFVKANETAEGRARLYQKASARTHSLDALRIGALGRLARVCGLPARATIDDIVGAVSRHTGRPADEVHALLVGDLADSDRDFIRLASDLADLETETANAIRSH